MLSNLLFDVLPNIRIPKMRNINIEESSEVVTFSKCGYES